MTAVLEASDISVRFGGVTAVDGASLSLERGEVLGLIGPNGSGKSTFLNALTGIVPAGGTLSVNGAAVPLGKPHRSRSAGLLRMFQAPQTFVELSCLENVLISQPDRSLTGLVAACALRPMMLRRERERWAAAERALDRVGLNGVAQLPAGQLSYGKRRLLELARALYADPCVLLLDEPSAGLNDTETSDLATVLEGLADDRLATILVDHKVDFVDQLSSRVVVLQLGSVIASGPTETIWSHPLVVDAYLGAA